MTKLLVIVVNELPRLDAYLFTALRSRPYIDHSQYDQNNSNTAPQGNNNSTKTLVISVLLFLYLKLHLDILN